MSLLPLFIEHGQPVMKISERPVEVIDGLDSLDVAWQTRNRDDFRVGFAPPEHPHMRIVEREPNRNGPVWTQRLRCEGILGHVPYKLLPYRSNSPEEGFDEIDQPVITREPGSALWARGAQLPGFPTMWITDRAPAQHRAYGYYDLGLRLKGIIEGKPAKRRIGTQTFTWSGDEIEWAMIQQGVVGWPPVAGGLFMGGFGLKNWEVDQPGISVTDTLLSLSPPPTWLVPGFWVPPDAPPLNLVPYVASENPRYHWPHGWHCANLQSEQVLNVACWFISIQWSTKPQSNPGGKASNVIRT